jgi:hypothetical protein
MPERSFFDLRYAIPGYTFILLFVGINYVCFFSRTGLDIFLAVLAVFGGSAFGFIISQFWWVLYEYLMGAEFHSEKRSINAVINKFELTRPRCLQDKRKVIVILDYVTRHTKRQDRKDVVQQERFFQYMARRWDMYHLMSSELIALGVGFLFGILFRGCLYVRTHLWKHGECYIVLTIFILVVIFFFMFLKGREWVRFQHDNAEATIVNSSRLERSDLGIVFPPYILDCSIREGQEAKLEEHGISTYSELAEADAKNLSDKTDISEEQLEEWIKKAKALFPERVRDR